MRYFLLIIVSTLFLAKITIADKCVTIEHTKTIYPNGETTIFDEQGVLMLDQKYSEVYGLHLQKADQALIADEFPNRITGSVNIVLFKNGCAVGEGRMPKQIFRNMIKGENT